jgi:hypothetical protein
MTARLLGCTSNLSISDRQLLLPEFYQFLGASGLVILSRDARQPYCHFVDARRTGLKALKLVIRVILLKPHDGRARPRVHVSLQFCYTKSVALRDCPLPLFDTPFDGAK